MTEIVERVADALAESFKSRVAASAGMSFEETKVELPQRSVWIEYANAAVKIVTGDLEFKIARLDLRPGDIVVLKSPKAISKQQADGMRQIIPEALGGHKALILDNGMDIAVLTAAEIAERAV